MKVSVLITTYNQEKFIAQAIESALMQETSFPYEIVIGEDCSTDRTRDLVQDYARKYPDKIRPLLHEINLGLQGKNNFVSTFRACCGQYIAILDGDDYWTDPTKLQSQVDFLETNPQYSMCCTNFSVVDIDGKLLQREGWWGNKQRDISHLEILQDRHPKTLTTMIRRSTLPDIYPPEFFNALNGDTFLFAFATRHGDAAFLDAITGCYRIHSQGVWSALNQIPRTEAAFETYSLMRQCFLEPTEQKVLKVRIYLMLRQLLVLYLLEFDTGKLGQITHHLQAYRFEQVFFAWAYAFRQMLIYHFKNSLLGQYTRLLWLNLRSKEFFPINFFSGQTK